jgi:hypothetical protein
LQLWRLWLLSGYNQGKHKSRCSGKQREKKVQHLSGRRSRRGPAPANSQNHLLFGETARTVCSPAKQGLRHRCLRSYRYHNRRFLVRANQHKLWPLPPGRFIRSRQPWRLAGLSRSSKGPTGRGTFASLATLPALTTKSSLGSHGSSSIPALPVRRNI